MKGPTPVEVLHEPERYEMDSPPAYHFEFDRRDFFRLLGGGIAVLLVLKSEEAFPQTRGADGIQEPLPQHLGAWLHIAPDGAVRVYTGKAEMGQNIRTSLSQAVAEELRVPVNSIALVMADTELTPFDRGTFGSRTTPEMGTQLRRVASVARDVLVRLAAKSWNVPVASLAAADGKIMDPKTGQSVEYAALARGPGLAKAVIEDDPLRPATEWTISGESLPKINGREFVTGKHRFSPDMALPGMLYGKVVRPPSFSATLTSVDFSEARAMPGVVTVHDGDFAGVAAPVLQDAERAAASVRAQWKTTPQISNQELFRYFKENTEEGEGRNREFHHEEGSVTLGLARAAQRLNQTYTVAYIAHAPLETRAALAEWKDGKVTVWTGSQRPFAVQGDIAQAFHIPVTRVRVIIPDTGGAYGGKHTGECAVEAARLARASRRPVKLVWTREEEFTWAYFRPAGVIEISSGIDHDGKLTAWRFQNYNSGTAGIQTPYEVPNKEIQFRPCKLVLRQGSYRCLAATGNNFARESHIDDLARLAKMDPLDFRRKNLKDERLLAVLNAAAAKFGWGRASKAPGRGFGLACGTEKGGYVTACAEVSVDRTKGTVRVIRVTVAFDCGAIVNPGGLKNQIRGAQMMGLGGALFEAIRFANGRILNDRFSSYRVPRFSDMPEIEVVLVDRKDLPSAGAGESPIMCIAPAVRNAILDATGTHLLSLPIVPDGLKA
ncbi:MAG: molybdopterin cofactor-binding domain-containing protein [Terriglobia bacterium]